MPPPWPMITSEVNVQSRSLETCQVLTQSPTLLLKRRPVSGIVVDEAVGKGDRLGDELECDVLVFLVIIVVATGPALIVLLHALAHEGLRESLNPGIARI